MTGTLGGTVGGVEASAAAEGAHVDLAWVDFAITMTVAKASIGSGGGGRRRR